MSSRTSFAIRTPNAHIDNQVKVRQEQYQQWFLEQSDNIFRRLNDVELLNKKYDKTIEKVDKTATTFNCDFESFKNSISEKLKNHIDDYSGRNQSLESKLAYIRQECTQRLNENDTMVNTMRKRVEDVVTKDELMEEISKVNNSINVLENKNQSNVKQFESLFSGLQDLIMLQSETINKQNHQMEEFKQTLAKLEQQIYEFRFVKLPEVECFTNDNDDN
jgi:hypothetical protein